MKPISDATKAAWLSGDYTGPRRAMARVTIQKLDVALFKYDVAAQQVRTEAAKDRSGKFASAYFGQVHRPLELPNLKSISWTRGVEEPIASATLEFFNTVPMPLGQQAAPGSNPTRNQWDFDQPGYYTFSRGKTAADRQRFGHGNPNGWQDLLVPDRLLHTYEGYGFDPTLPPERDPNMYPSGVWLIDSVRYTHDAKIVVEARDLGRMLADHICFPPVIPWAEYPMSWDAYHKVKDDPVLTGDAAWKRPRYHFDSNYYWNGGRSEHGHHGKDAFDASSSTYWLSIGNSKPREPYAYEYIEGHVKGTVSAARVHAYAGPYTVYISVMVGGKWQGKQTIPYQKVVYGRNKANIPFVASGTVGANGTAVIKLPKKYANAQRVRWTFSNLWNSGFGPNSLRGKRKYRAAVRSVDVLYDEQRMVSPPLREVGNYEDYCADDQTEVFTQRGWLRYDEVQPGDQTLAIDPQTGLSGWQVIEDVFRKHRRREMVLRESSVHSSLTTPDHKWLIKDHLDRWAWKTSETLKHGHSIPLTAPRADHPQLAKHQDALVELVAWYWTEGWTVAQGGCVNAELAQSRKVNPAHCDRIEAALFALAGPAGRKQGRTASWRMKQRPDGVVTYSLGQDLSKALLQAAPDKVPTPEFLLSLTRSQLALYIETSIDADGWRKGRARFLSQRSEPRIKAFEFACALAGIGTSVRMQGGMWQISLLAHKQFRPSLAKESRVEYDGVIWCPTLKHHNWLARRNGTVYFTGNTEIVKWFLAWSGFYWPPGRTTKSSAYRKHVDGQKVWLLPNDDPVLGKGRVWGDLEQTGTHNDVSFINGKNDKDGEFSQELGLDIWTMKPIIDCIAYVRDIVGFNFFIDESGGAVFRSPNIWALGNYISSPTGPEKTSRTSAIVDIDEQQTLVELTSALSSRNMYERVFIADVPGNMAGMAKGYNPYPSRLRRVTIWTDGVFSEEEGNAEPQRAADLLALRQMFNYRQNQLMIAANPSIQCDDQVRIYEAVTNETYVHYVQSIESSWDIESGEWTYQLTTNWLGERPFDRWAFDPYDSDQLDRETLAHLRRAGLLE